MSNFYLPSASESAASTPAKSISPTRRSYDDEYDDDDLDNLPYPTELPRNDFLPLDFNAQAYLSSLRNRHQTLEDLRSDLRQRSQLLNKELLDLVNGNYEEFLSLGEDLKGGEEKVESVRVGVLGFEREVEAIRRGLKVRLDEAGQLLQEKKDIKTEVMFGRRLLEIEERISELEYRLGLALDEGAGDELDLEDDADQSETTQDSGSQQETTVRIKGLQGNAERFLVIAQLIDQAGRDHPFIQAQKPRLAEARRTLLLDLATALKQAKETRHTNDVLDLLVLYGELGAESEGIKAVKPI